MNKLLYTALIAFILIIGSNLTLAFGSFNTNIIFGIWSLFNLFLTIFYLLSFNALLLKIAVALILLINSFFVYIGEYLNIEIDINIISSIMNTNYSEAM